MHLGTPGQRRAILRDLGARRPAWLAKAAQRMGETVTREWRKWSKITRDE
jgi:predicted alpha/beta hydrolase